MELAFSVQRTSHFVTLLAHWKCMPKHNKSFSNQQVLAAPNLREKLSHSRKSILIKNFFWVYSTSAYQLFPTHVSLQYLFSCFLYIHLFPLGCPENYGQTRIRFTFAEQPGSSVSWHLLRLFRSATLWFEYFQSVSYTSIIFPACSWFFFCM